MSYNNENNLLTFTKKTGVAIPDLIKHAIAETIKATESPNLNIHILNEKSECDESSYCDKSSDISDLEILNNSEALLSSLLSRGQIVFRPYCLSSVRGPASSRFRTLRGKSSLWR